MTAFIPKETLRVPSVMTEQESHRLVTSCDADFDARLNEAAETISRDCVESGVQVIRLSGPTCAGKTTTARKLRHALEKAGRSVYSISLDDFFYDRNTLLSISASNPNGLDYDSVKAMDIPKLAACVKDLMQHGEADIPVFDFETGNSHSTRHLKVGKGENPVFLFEGIQAVYPKVAALLDDVPNRSLFISVFRPIEVEMPDHEIRLFSTDRIRLMRRLVRDEAKRGADPAFTLYLWRTVRLNELSSILPLVNACDYQIDSAMGFDVHMLIPHLQRILPRVPMDHAEYPAAQAILKDIEGIQGIPSDDLAKYSVYHEFILK